MGSMQPDSGDHSDRWRYEIRTPGTAAAATAGSRYAFVSLPMTPGQSVDVPLLAMQSSDVVAPVQARPLGVHPDGSARWLLCEAVVPASGTCRIAPAPQAPEAEFPVAVQASPGEIVLDNGLCRVVLAAEGPSPVREIACRGRAVTAETPITLRHVTSGEAFTSRGDSSRALKVLAPGPVRGTAEAAGRHVSADGQAGLDYRLRVELFADLPAVVLRYWFCHAIPGRAELPVEAIELSLALRSPDRRGHVVQKRSGEFARPKPVTTTIPLDARVGDEDSTTWLLADRAPLGEDPESAGYLKPLQDEVSDWLATTVPTGWCAARVDDGKQMRPTGLHLDGGRLTVGLWPSWAGALSLPQGRSRSQTLRLAFFDEAGAAPAPEVVEAALASTRCEVPLLLESAAYVEAGVFEQDELLPHMRQTAKRFDEYLCRVACPPTVAEMFDLGDTPDPGYITTYTSAGRRVPYAVPPQQRRRVHYQTGVHGRLAPWSDQSQFEPVWANNEYDVIWCIGSEILRSRRGELFPSLRWFARHAIEVDFVHYSDDRWKHQATPAHSARHTTAGAYPSHFWTEGVLQYYALTGDEEALAFAEAIADKIIEIFHHPQRAGIHWKPTRELGWALLATAALVEFNPAKKYQEISREIADELIAAEFTDSFIAAVVQSAFGFASISLGVDKWYRLCGEAKYRDWLVAFARACVEPLRARPGGGVTVWAGPCWRPPPHSDFPVPAKPWMGEEGSRNATTLGPHKLSRTRLGQVSQMALCILHAAYRHCGDEELLRCGMLILERLMDSRAWVDPQLYTKPLAMLYRPLSRFLADAHRAGLLKQLDYRF